MKLEDAVIIVTGGASGIGAGVAEEFVSLGARVAIFDLASSAGASAAEALGERALFVPLDVTRPDDVERGVARVVEHFGRVDGLVNAAGISPAARVVKHDGTLFPLDLFRLGIEVNLIGAFDVLRNAAGAMSKNEPSDEGERGVIVNIASIAAFEGQVGQASYTASKGAIAAMTLPLARDLASHGIRVMTVAPGTIDTPMVQAESDEVRASIMKTNVFPPRMGTPADIAAVIRSCFEVTYFNGEIIRVDAGARLPPR